MKTKVTFNLSAEIMGDATGGMVLGDFNDWNAEQGLELKQHKNSSWRASVLLKAGQCYQYRYQLNDGRWVSDNNVDTAIHPENCVVMVTAAKDDLTKIDGIGKKIAELLVAANITTFSDLAKAPLKSLQVILQSAGSRYKSYDPSTWSEQAKSLADKSKKMKPSNKA